MHTSTKPNPDQADLSTLLCARSLVLASSSLSGEGGLLRDSPHLRDVYRFEPSEDACSPATPPRNTLRGHSPSMRRHSSLPRPPGAGSPGSWAALRQGAMKRLRTRDEPLCRAGPSGRAGCGEAARSGRSRRLCNFANPRPRQCATSLAGGGQRVREWCVHSTPNPRQPRRPQPKRL